MDVPPAHTSSRSVIQQQSVYHMPEVTHAHAPSLMPFGLSRPRLGGLSGLAITDPSVTHAGFDHANVQVFNAIAFVCEFML